MIGILKFNYFISFFCSFNISKNFVLFLVINGPNTLSAFVNVKSPNFLSFLIP